MYLVDAFTASPFGGNPAGVIPEADGLTDEQMQQIAREIHASETAFVFRDADQGDVNIRYFTPTDEIDFCGHATVAASWILATEYGWGEKAERVVLSTKIGLVPVAWQKENETLIAVEMTQVPPQVKDAPIEVVELCRLLGISTADVDDRYPIRLAYTGNWSLLVPLRTRRAVDASTPLFDELTTMNREHGISGVHLFTWDTDGLVEPVSGSRYDLYTRDFSPAVGILEDPVTGSANGALVGCLALVGAVNMPASLTIAQGHSMGRPGTLYARVAAGQEAPIVQIGGRAVPVIRGSMIM